VTALDEIDEVSFQIMAKMSVWISNHAQTPLFILV
jgi:hypothetical protein